MAGLVDVDLLRTSRENLDFLPEADTPIKQRRLRLLLTLSQCIYHSRTAIPPGFRPEKYQLSPLNMMNRAWFSHYLRDEEDDAPSTPKYPRRGIILADEGGMGKTLSSAIIALDELYKNPNQSIVVICPKLLSYEWELIFLYTPFSVHRINGEKVASGNLNSGINILSKHALLGHESMLQQHKGKISLLILDEAHEGFLTSPEEMENDFAPLSNSINLLTSKADKLVLATATPMRNGRDDLFKLCNLIEKGTFDNLSLDDDWFNSLKDLWLPAIENLRLGNEQEKTLSIISEHLGNFVSLPEIDLETLKNFIINLDFENQELRSELAIDLNPLGKFLSITLRDDLGRGTCQKYFRNMIAKTFLYDNPEADSIRKSLQDFGENQPSNWKIDFDSSPMNVINKRYKIGQHLADIGEIGNWSEKIKQCWSSDERLNKLKLIIDDELRNLVDTPQGIVLFSLRVGTNKAIKEWLEAQFEGKIKVFLFHPPPEDEKYDSRNKTLKDARNLSKKGDVLPVILSGESGSVGQNMEWATVMVHWDAIKSPAMICQKTWRLDRRVSEWDSVTRDFTSYHFVKRGTESDYISGVNESYRKQRLLLSDRRFFMGEDGFSLIPQSEEEPIMSLFSDSHREKHLTYPQAKWLFKFILGDISYQNSHSAETMAWAAIKELIGFDFWNGRKANDILEQTSLFPPKLTSELGDEPEEMLELLHLLISLTDDMEEQRSLVRYAGGNKDAKPLIPQSSPELMKERRPALLPSPTGSLISFFSKKLLDFQMEEGDDEEYENMFAFSVYSPEVLSENSRFNIYAHAGIIHLNMHPLGQIIRRVRGEETHCGLIEVQVEWDENYQCRRIKPIYLTFKNLNEEKYIKIFQHVAILSDQDIYPDDHYESQEFLGDEIPKILDSLDYRDFFTSAVSWDFGKAKDLAFGMSPEDFNALNQLRGDEDTIPLQKPTKEQIIPLIKVHSSGSVRSANHCPVCYSKFQCSKGTICYDNWNPAGYEFKDGDKESGWV